jgi:DNA-binding transcriptional ArsR family regulator
MRVQTTTPREMRLAREEREVANERIAKGLAHPLRVQIMGLLDEEDAAASEMAKKIGAEPSLVNYHTRILIEHGLAEVVRVEQVRGGEKKILRSLVPSLFDAPAWSAIDQGSRSGISRKVAENFVGRLSDALAAGTFDKRSDRILSHQTMSLDEEGWAEVYELVASCLEGIGGAYERAVTRSPESRRFPATVGILAFESPRMYERLSNPEAPQDGEPTD